MAQQEYIITNKLGGYSSSTWQVSNTRKYHGILVVGLLGDQRYCIVNRIEESVTIASQQFPLSTNYYKDGVLHPEGYKSINNFTNDPYPTWQYAFNNLEIEKSMVIAEKKNIVSVKYKINNFLDYPVTLNLIPLITFRDVNTLNHFGKENLYQVIEAQGQVLIQFMQGRFLKVYTKNLDYVYQQDIFYNFYYPEEHRRGYPAEEDLQKFGNYSFTAISGYSECEITFEFINEKAELERPDLFELYKTNQSNALASFFHNTGLEQNSFTVALAKQAESLILERMDTVGIVAGYHWFGEWGRDTFLSFKGLLLSTGKWSLAKKLLLSWAKLFKDGFLPNRPYFQDYASIDAGLLYANAVWEYFLKTEDLITIEQVMPSLEQILIKFKEGSGGVHVDEMGFLFDGNQDKALTWMDAKVDGKPVIARWGYAVDIQALWYNYLRLLMKLKFSIHDYTYIVDLKQYIKSIERRFERMFWNGSKKCLYDVVRSDFKDPAIRPNQLFVLYLPFSPLDKKRCKQILNTVERMLYTPIGLRTLPIDDPAYHGMYEGLQKNRDQAYHQGTIWTFLLGMYYMSALRTKSFSMMIKEKMHYDIIKTRNAFKQLNLDYLPEIFEASTYRPDGCLSQAWSVGLMIESLVGLYSTDRLKINKRIIEKDL